MSYHAFEGQGFDDVLLMENLQTPSFGIQMQVDMLTRQSRGNVVAFEINAEHAMPIDFARKMQPIKRDEPTVRVHRGFLR